MKKSPDTKQEVAFFEVPTPDDDKPFNKIRCKPCGTLLQSTQEEPFVRCRCKRTFIDHLYKEHHESSIFRLGWTDPRDIEFIYEVAPTNG